ncbi:hypothetical protein ABPG74_022516 [Tetrahymena malaccensis]
MIQQQQRQHQLNQKTKICHVCNTITFTLNIIAHSFFCYEVVENNILGSQNWAILIAFLILHYLVCLVTIFYQNKIFLQLCKLSCYFVTALHIISAISGIVICIYLGIKKNDGGESGAINQGINFMLSIMLIIYSLIEICIDICSIKYIKLKINLFYDQQLLRLPISQGGSSENQLECQLTN